MRLLIVLLLSFCCAAHAMPVSELLGKSVVDPAREDLGRIKDLIVDLREQRVRYAVLGFGGWAGLFDKQFAIPLEEFMHAPFGEKLLLDRRKEVLVLEPGADSTGVPDGEAELWRGIHRWYAREEDRRGLAPREFVRARSLLGREIVDHTGEPLGELVDLRVDLATGAVTQALLAVKGDMRRVPLSVLRVPASGAPIVYAARNP